MGEHLKRGQLREALVMIFHECSNKQIALHFLLLLQTKTPNNRGQLQHMNHLKAAVAFPDLQRMQ